MRERRVSLKLGINMGRITPAYAGKTDGKSRVICTLQDHPRVCGKD